VSVCGRRGVWRRVASCGVVPQGLMAARAAPLAPCGSFVGGCSTTHLDVTHLTARGCGATSPSWQ
jgi:hypothetical protein